jgi:hypothetical protein
MAQWLCRKWTFVATGVLAALLFLVLSPRFTGAAVFAKSVSSVALTSSLNPSNVAETVTLTATVTVPVGDPMPTGNVNFIDGAHLLATVALNASAQAVHVNTTFISANHALRTEYVGDGTASAGTSPVVNQLVYRNVPAVTGMSAPNPSLVGQAVTVTATIEGGSGAPVPTGNVAFTVDNAPLATVALNGSGEAALVTSSLAAGLHTIAVDYPGGIVFQGGKTNIAHTVDKNASEVSVVSSNNPSLAGQPVTFTATVRGSAAGAPPGTGSVVFKEGNIVLSTRTLDSNGQGAFATSSLAAGSHTITAEYAGDGYYLGGTSPPLDQTVSLVGASVALVSLANPSPYAEAVTFTATATGSSVTPTGVMTFHDGSTILGNANLDGSGVASFSTSTLGAGSHTITAEYGGDGVYAAGAMGTVTQIIDRAATSSVLAVSTGSTTTETIVTWTATVTSTAGGTIGGTVTFEEGLSFIGTGALGSGGIATTSAMLVAGTHDVTATFAGDTNYAPSTSPPVTTTVIEPEAGVDGGSDAAADASSPGDAMADASDGTMPPSVDSGPADAGSTTDALSDVSRVDAGVDASTRDTSMPPRSDVTTDVPIANPDGQLADGISPPVADARADIGTDAGSTNDARSDAARADAGHNPLGDDLEEDTGCGCRIDRRGSSRAGFALAIALLGIAVVRTRGRRGERVAKMRKP